jgi:pilus assembly protein Flp/PilA
MDKLLNSIRSFWQDDEGSQVVEYALIIAVVAIALVVALRLLATGTSFSSFISRVSTCLTGTGNACV